MSSFYVNLQCYILVISTILYTFYKNINCVLLQLLIMNDSCEYNNLNVKCNISLASSLKFIFFFVFLKQTDGRIASHYSVKTYSMTVINVMLILITVQ